jgi:formylglycine-generating enzyme required for sulfatase activity
VLVIGAFAYSKWGGSNPIVKPTIVPKYPLSTDHIGEETVNDRSEVPWYRTVAIKKAGVEVPFAFVIPTDAAVAPFYISQTKITNGVVKRAYEDADFKDRLGKWKKFVGPKLEKQCFPQVWEKGGSGEKSDALGVDNNDWPALRMTAAEAAVLAEWLGGKLPTPKQWIAAAGIDAGKYAPFELPPEKVARNRSNGPAPVKSFPEDLSIHGVFDVAGNGREWTRSFVDGDLSIHDPNALQTVLNALNGASANMYLRGFDYGSGISAKEVLENVKSNTKYGHQAWTDPEFDTGFRVVLEP